MYNDVLVRRVNGGVVKLRPASATLKIDAANRTAINELDLELEEEIAAVRNKRTPCYKNSFELKASSPKRTRRPDTVIPILQQHQLITNSARGFVADPKDVGVPAKSASAWLGSALYCLAANGTPGCPSPEQLCTADAVLIPPNGPQPPKMGFLSCDGWPLLWPPDRRPFRFRMGTAWNIQSNNKLVHLATCQIRSNTPTFHLSVWRRQMGKWRLEFDCPRVGRNKDTGCGRPPLPSISVAGSVDERRSLCSDRGLWQTLHGLTSTLSASLHLSHLEGLIPFYLPHALAVLPSGTSLTPTDKHYLAEIGIPNYSSRHTTIVQLQTVGSSVYELGQYTQPDVCGWYIRVWERAQQDPATAILSNPSATPLEWGISLDVPHLGPLYTGVPYHLAAAGPSSPSAILPQKPQTGKLVRIQQLEIVGPAPSYKKIFLSTDIHPLNSGPSDDQLTLQSFDNSEQLPCIHPSMDGHMLVPPQKVADFDMVQVYTYCRLCINMFERVLADPLVWPWNRVLWADQPQPLKVHPYGPKEATAYYDRAQQCIVLGTHPIKLCHRVDILTHELGHAVLDSLQPQWISSRHVQALALHEAFADATSMCFAFTRMELCDIVVNTCQGNLRLIDNAFHQQQVAGTCENTLQMHSPLKSAANTLKLQDIQPTPSSLSLVMTGLVFDLLCHLYDDKFRPGCEASVILFEQSNYVFTLFTTAISRAPVLDPCFVDIVQDMLQQLLDSNCSSEVILQWLQNIRFRQVSVIHAPDCVPKTDAEAEQGDVQKRQIGDGKVITGLAKLAHRYQFGAPKVTNSDFFGVPSQPLAANPYHFYAEHSKAISCATIPTCCTPLHTLPAPPTKPRLSSTENRSVHQSNDNGSPSTSLHSSYNRQADDQTSAVSQGTALLPAAVAVPSSSEAPPTIFNTSTDAVADVIVFDATTLYYTPKACEGEDSTSKNTDPQKSHQMFEHTLMLLHWLHECNFKIGLILPPKLCCVNFPPSPTQHKAMSAARDSGVLPLDHYEVPPEIVPFVHNDLLFCIPYTGYSSISICTTSIQDICTKLRIGGHSVHRTILVSHNLTIRSAAVMEHLIVIPHPLMLSKNFLAPLPGPTADLDLLQVKPIHYVRLASVGDFSTFRTVLTEVDMVLLQAWKNWDQPESVIIILCNTTSIMLLRRDFPHLKLRILEASPLVTDLCCVWNSVGQVTLKGKDGQEDLMSRTADERKRGMGEDAGWWGSLEDKLDSPDVPPGSGMLDHCGAVLTLVHDMSSPLHELVPEPHEVEQQFGSVHNIDHDVSECCKWLFQPFDKDCIIHKLLPRHENIKLLKTEKIQHFMQHHLIGAQITTHINKLIGKDSIKIEGLDICLQCNNNNKIFVDLTLNWCKHMLDDMPGWDTQFLSHIFHGDSYDILFADWCPPSLRPSNANQLEWIVVGVEVGHQRGGMYQVQEHSIIGDSAGYLLQYSDLLIKYKMQETQDDIQKSAINTFHEHCEGTVATMLCLARTISDAWRNTNDDGQCWCRPLRLVFFNGSTDGLTSSHTFTSILSSLGVKMSVAMVLSLDRPDITNTLHMVKDQGAFTVHSSCPISEILHEKAANIGDWFKTVVDDKNVLAELHGVAVEPTIFSKNDASIGRGQHTPFSRIGVPSALIVAGVSPPCKLYTAPQKISKKSTNPNTGYVAPAKLYPYEEWLACMGRAVLGVSYMLMAVNQ